MKFLLASALVVCAPFAYCTSFSNGQAARAVIGQYEFTQNNAAANSQIVGGVSGLAYDGSGLWVADGDVIGALVNNRVLRFAITGQLQVPHADLSVVGSPTADNSCVLCGYVADVVLGQVDFVSVTAGTAATASSSTAGSMSNPTAVASDGVHLAVVDTGNNRILIWNSLPLASNTPPNVVLGQRDFTTVQPLTSVNASSLRAPQGIWIEGGKLFVADTGNDRVLIWNSIPSTNNQPADLVLGQPNFSTVNAPPLSSTAPTAAANQLWNPISVTVSADGTHLLVADFGFNRVLIWNSIPSSNQQAADVVVGQPDMASSQANNASAECASNGKDSNGNPTYPLRCETTVDHPRFALFNGTQLFIADTGNDRVLVYNELPSSNKTAADFVLGQPDFQSDVVTGQASSAFSTILNNAGSTDTIPTPMALAWDGTNLYVSDPTDRRVMIFTPGDTVLPQKSVLNNASKITRQEGFVTVSGTPVANDTVTITIAGTNYTYTIAKNDTLTSVVNGLISKINSGSGDPNAQALTGNAADTVYLDSKGTNNDLNTIAFSASSSNTSDITVTTSGSYLTGGNSGTAAPGTLVEIDDPSNSLADFTTSASPTQGFPGILKDPNHPGSTVQVFMDGLSAPLMYASPGQVIAQVPYFVDPNSHQPDRDSISVYVRTVHANGNITVTNAQPVVVAAAVPGLFGAPTQNEPRPAFGALHQAGNPSATISIDGSAQAGDVITITVSGTNYTYTVLSSDSLASIVSALVTEINNANDPNVTAAPGGEATRIVLTARKSGAAGSGISVSGSVTAASGKSSATETVTAFTSATCCASSGGLPVTVSNPAQANEVITLLATGLGTIQDSSANYIGVTAGVPYSGPQPNSSQNLVIATVQGGTAQVISAGLPAGGVGTYQIQVLMPSSLPSSGVADIYVAQNAFFSNTVTLPVGSAGTSPINIFIDVPNGSGQYERGVLNAAGWAIDNNASISQVAVWLDGTPYVNNATRVARPDVCRAYPSAQDCANGKVNVGWAATINTANLTGGTHSLAVIVSASDGTVDSRMTTFTLVNPMRLYIDSPVNGSTVSGTIPLGGWAISNGGTVPTSNIAVFVDGVPINGVVGVARPDVCAAFPSAQDCANGNVNVGWAASLDTTLLANGSHTLTLRATDSNSVNAAIAATFTVNNAAPSNMQIYIDNPGNPTGTLVGTATLQGWAFSTVAAVSSVNLSVDGVRVGTAATNPRPDVCAAHANAFGCPAAQLGWHLPLDTTKLANGTHQLEVTATAGGQSETITSSFSVANWTTTTSVHVFIDTPNYQNTYSGVISAEGWAVSDQAAITSVAISVDGVQLGNASLGVARPDVCAAYPGRNGCPNVGWVLQFDSTLLNDGSHSLMATATDANGELATLNMTFTVANTGSPIQMFVDTNLGQALSGTAQIEGWAGSSSSPVTAVTLSVDGFQRATTTPGIGRPDVCGVYPNLIGCPSGTNLGWIASLDTTVLAPGPHVLDVTAKTANGNHTISRNFTVSSAGSAVRGYIDRPTQNATLVGVVQISGWSTNSGNPSSVVISIDGMPYPQLTVSYIARPDVCAAFGYTGTCPNVGWSVLFDTRQLGDGAHTLSATGTSGGQTGTVSTTINVANFTNTSPIQIGIDPLSSNGAPVAGILTLSGYAFSNSGSVSQVSIAIDGVPQLSPVTYGVPRTDVCNGGNGAPGCPDVGWQTTLDTTLLPDGTHTLDVTATVNLTEPNFLQPVSATTSTTFTVQNLGGA